MRVLVVDDDDGVRRVVRRTLERADFTVVDAADPEQALTAVELDPVDVAVLDLNLPVMSGLELMSHLRNRDPGLPVIILTGAGSEAERVQGLVSGADDYVVKPFSGKELAARVQAVARRRRAHADWYGGDLPAEAASDRSEAGVQAAGAPATGAPSAPTAASGREPAHPEAVAAADLTADPTVVIQGDKVVHANSAAVELVTAGGPEELVGRSFLDFVAPQSIGASMARHHDASAGRWPRPEVLTLLRVDGTAVHVEVASMPVIWNGEQASQLTLWDLGANTSRLRELATGISSDVAEAVVVADADMRIRSFNQAAELLYGWHEEEVLGKDLWVARPWNSDAAVTAEIVAAFEQEGRWHGNLDLARRDGTPITVRTTATLLRDRSGAAVGVILVDRLADRALHTSERSATAPSSPDRLLVDQIHRGIENGEFTLRYQPVVDLVTCSWLGVEALVRWEHPEHGLLSPAAFIDVAERSGAIIELGQAVLDQAAQQWRRWKADGIDLHVAVNLSGRQLADPDLTARIESAMSSADVPPGALRFEVTETALVEDLAQATAALGRLVDLGVEIAIDDFGTGWASLTYLREFPVHALKIDRVFVNGLGVHVPDAAIVSSIISLGSELGLGVIAEGIETEEQLHRLIDLKCPSGQGYLFAKPMTAVDVEANYR